MSKNGNLHAAKKSRNDEFCLNDAIQNGDIIFLRADGTPAENLVVWNCNSEGYYTFFEILGQSEIDVPKKLTLGGVEKYRRLMVQRVYPYGLVGEEVD